MHPAVLRFGAAAVVTGGLAWVTLSLGPPPPPRWEIVERVSAHRALVLQVETRDPENALATARTIIEREPPRFDEILVFFHSPGRRDMLSRVRWTPMHGYELSTYE